MPEIEERLRDAMEQSVAGLHVPFDAVLAARNRYRRRNGRLAGGAVLVAVAVVAAYVAVVPKQHVDHPGPAIPPVPAVFPGGGRVLLSDGKALTWVAANGAATQIATGVAGASLAGSRLLAWKAVRDRPDDYYTMNLDGTDQTLVLPAQAGAAGPVISAELSADGRRLAYVRQGQHDGGSVTDTLWWLDIATGQRHPLGPISYSYTWKDADTLLATAADGKSLTLINLADNTRSTYLSVTDRAVVAAYQKAQPTAGAPKFLQTDGFSTGKGAPTLAVWVGQVKDRGGIPQRFPQPAELLVAPGSVRVFAPPTPVELDLIWGPNGTFLLRSGAPQSLEGWNSYLGRTTSDKLSPPYETSSAGPAAINPQGTALALGDDELLRFASADPLICDGNGRCPHGQTVNLVGPGPFLVGHGTIIAWLP